MNKWCAIKDNSLLAIGTLDGVIQKIFNWRLNERELMIRPLNHRERTFHSYSEAFTDEEIRYDVNNFLLSIARDYGFEIFKAYER
jgi:hypothetical protein